jgi:hypothetical protein
MTREAPARSPADERFARQAIANSVTRLFAVDRISVLVAAGDASHEAARVGGVVSRGIGAVASAAWISVGSIASCSWSSLLVWLFAPPGGTGWLFGRVADEAGVMRALVVRGRVRPLAEVSRGVGWGSSGRWRAVVCLVWASGCC